jgi:hypothetical protein
MKTSVAVVSALASASVAFAAGAWTAMRSGWGSRTVVANIVNDTDRTVRSIAVHFETCGGTGTVPGGELPPGASRQLRYSVCGEGAYSIEASFADGSVLRGSEGYVEVGYVSIDRIKPDRITSTQRIYGPAL